MSAMVTPKRIATVRTVSPGAASYSKISGASSRAKVGVAGKVGEMTGSGWMARGVADGGESTTACVASERDSWVSEVAGGLGEGKSPEPIAPGGGTSARVQAIIPSNKASAGRTSIRSDGQLLLAADLIEFIATSTCLNLLFVLCKIAIIRVSST